MPNYEASPTPDPRQLLADLRRHLLARGTGPTDEEAAEYASLDARAAHADADGRGRAEAALAVCRDWTSWNRRDTP